MLRYVRVAAALPLMSEVPASLGCIHQIQAQLLFFDVERLFRRPIHLKRPHPIEASTPISRCRVPVEYTFAQALTRHSHRSLLSRFDPSMLELLSQGRLVESNPHLNFNTQKNKTSQRTHTHKLALLVHSQVAYPIFCYLRGWAAGGGTRTPCTEIANFKEFKCFLQTQKHFQREDALRATPLPTGNCLPPEPPFNKLYKQFHRNRTVQ